LENTKRRGFCRKAVGIDERTRDRRRNEDRDVNLRGEFLFVTSDCWGTYIEIETEGFKEKARIFSEDYGRAEF